MEDCSHEVQEDCSPEEHKSEVDRAPEVGAVERRSHRCYMAAAGSYIAVALDSMSRT